jgi:hypothetical protein
MTVAASFIDIKKKKKGWQWWGNKILPSKCLEIARTLSVSNTGSEMQTNRPSPGTELASMKST